MNNRTESPAGSAVDTETPERSLWAKPFSPMPHDDSSPAKALTMEQIGKAAGVSKMTVSLALRGDPRIAPATGERIRALAQKLGYRPNPLVQALMTNLRSIQPTSYHTTIAWIDAFKTRNGWKEQPTHQLYYKGAVSRASVLGYKIEPFWILAPRMTGIALSRMLRARGIRGLIVPPIEKPGSTLDLDWEHFSCVTIGYSFPEPRLHRAAANLHDGMRCALAECTRLGLRRVGFAIPADTDALVNHAWLATYLAWQQFIPAKDRLKPLLAIKPVQDLLPAWLEKQRPEVIISINREFMQWLPELGLRVPEDIGLISLSTLSQTGPHNISGLDQNDFSVGESAIDLVVSLIQHNEIGIPDHARQVLIDGQWHAGKTLASDVMASRPIKTRKTARV